MKYQLVRHVGPGAFENEFFSGTDFLSEFEKRGFKPNGCVEADHPGIEIRGKLRFEKLHGPMLERSKSGETVLRYEDLVVSNMLST